MLLVYNFSPFSIMELGPGSSQFLNNYNMLHAQKIPSTGESGDKPG